MHTFSHSLDMILTIVVLAFWFIFPIGIFIAQAQLDKNSDQIARFVESHQVDTQVAAKPETPRPEQKRPKDFGRPTLLPH